MVKNFLKILPSLVFITNFSYAVQNSKLLSSDETQKKYVRKVVVGMDIGLPTRNLKVPVTFCQKVNNKIKCRFERNINYYISQTFEDKLAKNIYDWVITQRFDKVILAPDKVYIITALGTQVFDENLNKTFDFDTGSYEDYKKALEKYLNTYLSPIVYKLLAATLEKRYKELPEKEKETFIKTKAKELGIPYEVAKKLMSTGFVFGVYLDPRDTSIKTIFKTLKIGKKEVPNYEVAVKHTSKAKLVIFKFDPDKKKFVFYKEIPGFSGLITKSENLEVPPKDTDYYALIEQALLTGSNAVGINLNYEIKKDDNFAIFTTVSEVQNKKVKAPIGVLEDLRVDSPYIIQEKINGKIVNVGFVKARKVAINCKKTLNSEFELIKGKAELKDRLKEHPWTGVFFSVSGGLNSFEIDKINNESLSKGGGNLYTVKIGTSLDLGYVFNSNFFSEVWANLNLKYAFGGDDLTFDNGAKVGDAPNVIAGDLKITKRFYIKSGFFASVGGLVEYAYISADNYNGTSDSLSINTFYLGVGGEVGYNFNPDTELILNIFYKYPVAAWSDNVDSVDMKSGFNAEVSLNIHMPFVGNFATLFSKPSKVCKVKK